MPSHSGGVISIGHGAVYSTAIRQKTNTKSSTEAEMVGVNDMMGQVLWTRALFEEQGHLVSRNVIYQEFHIT